MPVLAAFKRSRFGRGYRRRNAMSVAAAGLALCLALAGCAGDGGAPAAAGPQKGDSDYELYQGAKEEGSLVWYSSTPSAAVDLFKKTYPGIELEFVRLPAGQLGTRFSQEVSSGAPGADVITIADDRFIADAKEKKWLEPTLDVPEAKTFPDKYLEDGVATIGIAAYGIAYNTNKLGADGPKDWPDLVDPKYDGQIMMGDPREVPGYLALAYLWEREYGSEFLTKFTAQGAKVQASGVAVNEALAAGAASVAPNTSLALLAPLKDKGAPIEYVQPRVTTGSEFYSGISSSAKHPAAAKLLMNFLLSEKGQVSFNENQSSPRGDIGGKTVPLPSGYERVPFTKRDEVRSSVLKELGLA